MGSNLVIPPAFVRHLNGGIPKDIILKDYAGRQWHCRGLPDFQIQWRFYVYMVNIFGRNGCIKEGTLFPNLDINHVKKKTETEEDHTFGTLDHAREQKYSKTIPKRTKKPGRSSRSSRFKAIRSDVTAAVERKTRSSICCPKESILCVNHWVEIFCGEFLDCGEVTRYPSEARDDCLR
ncbi:hypothetical protein ACOSQ3_023427 [Xanthoceras sorbifolium]